MSITINDIIRAVDTLICKYDLFTDADFQKVFGYRQPLSKAAQATMTQRTPKLTSDQIRNLREDQQYQEQNYIERQIWDLLQQGVKPGDISRRLNTTITTVRYVAEKKGMGGKPQQQNEWLRNKYEQPIKNVINEQVDANNHVNAITIAEMLGVEAAMVKQILNTSGISIRQLETDRRDKLVQIMKEIAEELDVDGIDLTLRNTSTLFYQKTGQPLPNSTYGRLIAFAGVSGKNQKTDIFENAINNWIWSSTGKGVDRFIDSKIEEHRGKRENILAILHETFNNLIQKYGKNLNLDMSQPVNIDKLKQLISIRLQLKVKKTDLYLKNKKPNSNPETYKNIKNIKINPELSTEDFLKTQPKRKRTSSANNWYKIAKESEKLTGGRADGKTVSKYPKDQVEKGRRIEREHTNNKDIATEITKDHLEEFSDYYDGLEQMEQKLKNEKKK